MIRRPPADAAAKAEAWLRDNGFESLPVDLDAIAVHLDIKVGRLEQDGPGVSGMLLRQGDAFGILYGTYVRSVGFRRFSIAHEIGHYLLEGHPEHLFPPGTTSHVSNAGFESADPYEREADFFASGLLMPDGPFKAAMRRLDDGLTGIEALADKCLTSMTATAIAYARKASVPVSVVVSTRGRVDYAYSSAPMGEFDGSTPAKGSLVPSSTATSRLAASEVDVRSGKRLAEEVDLRTWFGGSRRLDATEEVLGLGSYGRVLTVLSTDTLPEDEDEDRELDERWTARFRR